MLVSLLARRLTDRASRRARVVTSSVPGLVLEPTGLAVASVASVVEAWLGRLVVRP